MASEPARMPGIGGGVSFFFIGSGLEQVVDLIPRHDGSLQAINISLSFFLSKYYTAIIWL